jgi:hypothetical protein
MALLGRQRSAIKTNGAAQPAINLFALCLFSVEHRGPLN